MLGQARCVPLGLRGHTCRGQLSLFLNSLYNASDGPRERVAQYTHRVGSCRAREERCRQVFGCEINGLIVLRSHQLRSLPRTSFCIHWDVWSPRPVKPDTTS